VQQSILDQFQEYILRAPGAEGANVVMAWHGAAQQYQLSNAIKGFRKMPPITDDEEQRLRRGELLDAGYIGRGVYFSQYPSYGRDYAAPLIDHAPITSASSTCAEVVPSSCGAGGMEMALGEAEVLLHPIMLCHVIMGRVYPVHEHPYESGFDESKHGKQCQPGYDSHYSVVTGPRSMMVPIKQCASGEVETGKADELCIFNPCQVLPGSRLS
jgi:hypothetical protein